MGIESRDWFREESKRARAEIEGGVWRPTETKGARSRIRVRSRSSSVRSAAFFAVLLVGFLVFVNPATRERLGYELPFGLDSVFHSDATPGAIRIQPIPGVPGLTIGGEPLYAPDDPWRRWLADERACPKAEDVTTPRSVQVRSLLCLVNFARREQGVPPLKLSTTLSSAAALKAQAIVRCDEFGHEACGRPADIAARRLGYQGSWGENLYMGNGTAAAPRVAVDQWLNSDGHRVNLFRAEWRVIGIALVPNADVDAMRDGAVWVNQFGG